MFIHIQKLEEYKKGSKNVEVKKRFQKEGLTRFQEWFIISYTII